MTITAAAERSGHVLILSGAQCGFSRIPTAPTLPVPASLVASRGDSAAPFARAICNSAPTTAPSPIAAPTRLTEPDRTSPEAKTPRTLVSSGSGRLDPWFDRPASEGRYAPVAI